MKSESRSCASCSSFDPACGCWASVSRSEQAGTLPARSGAMNPDNFCKNHRTWLESDALDAAIYALWAPLLIKSRTAAGRRKSRRDGE